MDPFEVLGVPRTATSEEIRDAYHRHARLTHPDLNPGGSASAFLQVCEAYESLSTGRRGRGEEPDPVVPERIRPEPEWAEAMRKAAREFRAWCAGARSAGSDQEIHWFGGMRIAIRSR